MFDKLKHTINYKFIVKKKLLLHCLQYNVRTIIIVDKIIINNI